MSEQQFAFGARRGARLTVVDAGDFVGVTLTVRVGDGTELTVADIISRTAAAGIASAFTEAAGEAGG